MPRVALKKIYNQNNKTLDALAKEAQKKTSKIPVRDSSRPIYYSPDPENLLQSANLVENVQLLQIGNASKKPTLSSNSTQLTKSLYDKYLLANEDAKKKLINLIQNVPSTPQKSALHTQSYMPLKRKKVSITNKLEKEKLPLISRPKYKEFLQFKDDQDSHSEISLESYLTTSDKNLKLQASKNHDSFFKRKSQAPV